MKQKLLIALLFALPLHAQSLTAGPQAIRAYINNYKYCAVALSREYNVPAAIILAQGILESNAGASYLAREHNNHFGTRCGSSTARSYRNDVTGRCYRAYNDADSSFRDHCRVLTSPRYLHLRALPLTDYVSWAEGLQDAGYATASSYADRLVSIIETYGLFMLDY